jgi:hypothetical protein
MKINGIEGMTLSHIQSEVARGGKFVIFPYCISIVVMTFRRSSDIHFIKADESALSASIGYIMLSLLFGWWGIPWGPIFTIGSIYTNLTGGKDVTQEMMASIARPTPMQNQ